MNNKIKRGFSHPTQSTRYFQFGSMQIKEDDFKSFITIKLGLAPQSIRHCMGRIRIINAWFEEKDLTKENTEKFYLHLKQKGLKNNSLNTYNFAFRQLVEYCKDRGFKYDFFDGFKSFKKTKPDIIILTPDEIENILNTKIEYGKLYGKDCSFLDSRDKTLIMFLAFTGCRFSEAANLEIKHLDLASGRAIFVETKTNENRSVYFAEPLKSSLQKLVVGFSNDDLVFRNSLEKRIHESDFSAQLKKRAILAGISKRVYPHLFRHSFATQLLISGIDVAIVSKILGHKDVRTTVENYLHLADETLKEATFMHPLIRRNIDPLLIIRSVRERFDEFHFEADKRFKYSVSEDKTSIKFEISLI